MKPVVVLTDHVFPDEDAVIERGVLSQAGIDLDIQQCRDEDGLIEITRQADGLLVERAFITPRVMDHMERCKVIVRYGVGYDSLDVESATDHGICICNVPDYCVPEVADHTIALMLACARRLFQLDAEVRSGGWDVYGVAQGTQRIEGQVLGMIGSGRIGRGVARRALGFGLNVAVYDPYLSAEQIQSFGGKKVELEELLKSADFITLHLPLSAATRHTLNAEKIAMLKPSAFIINSARGGLIDTLALADAIANKKIAGAGLDTFESEPLEMDHPLRKLPNVILTPHAAFYSEGASRDLHRMAAEEAARVIQGKLPHSLVNRDVLSKLRAPLA